MKLLVGDRAPDFTLPSTSGEPFTLSEELRNVEKPIVLFFYPGDFSTLCTREVIAFRDEIDRLEDTEGHRYDIVGISTNNMESHRRFRKKFLLPFELLSDPAGEVCRMYDAYRPLFGQASRMTFAVDTDQTIQTIYDGQFRVFKHVEHAIRAICHPHKVKPVTIRVAP